jgi:hypothetical protein
MVVVFNLSLPAATRYLISEAAMMNAYAIQWGSSIKL